MSAAIEQHIWKCADTHEWGYAGGSVEIDETVEDTAKRELFEETGLVAEELELLGVYSGKHMHNIYPNGDEVSNIDIVYVCSKIFRNFEVSGV